MTHLKKRRCRRDLSLTFVTLASLVVGHSRAMASGNAERGAAVFVRQCALCHSIERGDANRFGPNLFGIVDRKAATAPGYRYSAAFRALANWSWSPDAIISFIAAPRLTIPDNQMAVFQGVADNDLDDIIAYLLMQK